MLKILVTGGCGYIGSHTIVDLIQHGYEVVCVDNLMNAEESVLEGVKKITGVSVKNYNIDLCDPDLTAALFKENPDIKGVIHFAALKSVGESVEKPVLYFKNNLGSMINLMEQLRLNRIPYFVFSSSCTVYGSADELPVNENSPIKQAESPYGRTKQISENILQDCIIPEVNKAISLRYFNPAGAHHSAHIGELSKMPALNLVPIITETAIGKREALTVFGDDYNTKDGSCVRDYIHIEDLAEAHRAALEYLIDNKIAGDYEVFNLGYGTGISVFEAIEMFEQVSGQKINVTVGPRRPGDVEAIYADISKAKNRLNWAPKKSLKEIMSSAWNWEKIRHVD